MAKQGENLSVTCPCCQAKLVVDPAFGAVLSHEAHVRPGPDVDLTKASDILEEKKRNGEKKSANFSYKKPKKKDTPPKKSKKAIKKARAPPAGKPLRDFDLD